MKTVWRVRAPASHELITSAEAQRNAVRVDKLPRGAKITEHDAAGLRQEKLVVLDVAVDQIVRLQVLHGTLRNSSRTRLIVSTSASACGLDPAVVLTSMRSSMEPNHSQVCPCGAAGTAARRSAMKLRREPRGYSGMTRNSVLSAAAAAHVGSAM